MTVTPLNSFQQMAQIDRWILLKILSDRSSMEIFQHLARSYDSKNFDGISVPITKTSMTRRQYYRRLAQMIKIGLVVKNNNGKYNLSSFGILIHFHLQSIDNLVDHYWKIQAVDAMKNAVASKKLTEDEFQKVVEGLVGDQVIKKLLLGETKPNSLLFEETKQNIIKGK
jgi:hypothetical protein